jgi:replicative DNA helicase
MVERTPPHNLEAEAALLGILLIPTRGDAIGVAERLVGPEDFYKPLHQAIYSTILDLWKSGSAPDAVVVGDLLKREGSYDQPSDRAYLVSLLSQAPPSSSAAKYAEIVAEMSMYRKIIRVCDQVRDDAYATRYPASDLVDGSTTALEAIQAVVGELPPGVWQLDDFLNRPQEQRAPWAVPGLLRVGWRVMVVAAEGTGKSVVQRQIAIMAAQGIHPFTLEPIMPVRTLIVDLENPDDSIVDICEPIRDRVFRRSTNFDPGRAWLWHRPQGIDLRSRYDRTRFESVVAHTRPDLVCMGPIYKCYSVAARENDELAAGEVQRVFDDLRTRYSFGLLLEHHAPKGQGGARREMMPYGSSLWLRWPEIGLGLQEDSTNPERLVVGRWRGDRLQSEWPEALTRGGEWPWEAEYRTGTFRPPPAPPGAPYEGEEPLEPF